MTIKIWVISITARSLYAAFITVIINVSGCQTLIMHVFVLIMQLMLRLISTVHMVERRQTIGTDLEISFNFDMIMGKTNSNETLTKLNERLNIQHCWQRV